MDEPGVVAGLAICGIYDLEPVRLSYLNDKLKLEPQNVTPLSPALLPLSARPLVIAYGDSELPELQRQSREFFHSRLDAGLPGALLPQAGQNHFTILEELANPQGSLALAVSRLERLAK